MDMKKIFVFLTSSFLWGDHLFLDYQRINQETFNEVIVGNTIVGITRQSKSLYMLYFLPEGSCELWKQNQIYSGRWWIDQDPKGEDVVHAFWPDYISLEPKSLFSLKNPSYGKPTSLRYYFDKSSGAILIRGKTFQTSVLLAPGCIFPSQRI